MILHCHQSGFVSTDRLMPENGGFGLLLSDIFSPFAVSTNGAVSSGPADHYSISNLPESICHSVFDEFDGIDERTAAQVLEDQIDIDLAQEAIDEPGIIPWIEVKQSLNL